MEGAKMADDNEPRTAGLEDTVRAYLNARTDTPYAIAKKAGISRQQMYRFIDGKRGLTLDSLDKLCYVLGLVLKPIHQVEPADDEATRAKREAMRAQLETESGKFMLTDEPVRKRERRGE